MVNKTARTAEVPVPVVRALTQAVLHVGSPVVVTLGEVTLICKTQRVTEVDFSSHVESVTTKYLKSENRN